MVFFFFFKQKTAYEMRISDWSSDVCSSDLDPVHRRRLRIRAGDEVRVLVAGQGGAAFAGLYARAGTRPARRACRDGDRARLHPDRPALRPAAHRAGLPLAASPAQGPFPHTKDTSETRRVGKAVKRKF